MWHGIRALSLALSWTLMINLFSPCIVTTTSQQQLIHMYMKLELYDMNAHVQR